MPEWSKGMDLRPIAEMLAGSNPAPDNSIFYSYNALPGAKEEHDSYWLNYIHYITYFIYSTIHLHQTTNTIELPVLVPTDALTIFRYNSYDTHDSILILLKAYLYR